MSLTLVKPSGEEVELVEEVKKGKRLYGGFYKVAGVLVYMAYRKQAEIFRAGEGTISEALRSGKASWALDDETLFLARAKGAKFVGVMVRDTGDRYLARIETWFDRGKVSYINYEKKGGSHQRVLRLSEFAMKRGEARL